MPTVLTKAVIPAAGMGTRMLPAAKAVPKELLPILDRPTVQYVVEEAAAAGITDVLMVTSRQKPALMNHFTADGAASAKLAAAGKGDLLRSIDDLLEKVRVHAAYQEHPKGLGDAVAWAKHFAADEPFLCLLGDTIFTGAIGPATQLADAHRRFGSAVIGLQEVSEDNVSRYGIVGGLPVADGVIKIDRLVEKPSAAAAPSRLAIAARYVLTPAIFDCLDATPPGKGGEVQLTDALQELCRREAVHGVVLKSTRHDVGNPLDWLRTNLIAASLDAVLWDQLRPLIERLIDTPR